MDSVLKTAITIQRETVFIFFTHIYIYNEPNDFISRCLILFVFLSSLHLCPACTVFWMPSVPLSGSRLRGDFFAHFYMCDSISICFCRRALLDARTLPEDSWYSLNCLIRLFDITEYILSDHHLCLSFIGAFQNGHKVILFSISWPRFVVDPDRHAFLSPGPHFLQRRIIIRLTIQRFFKRVARAAYHYPTVMTIFLHTYPYSTINISNGLSGFWERKPGPITSTLFLPYRTLSGQIQICEIESVLTRPS